MYKKLAEICLVRTDVPDEHKFLNIGRLIYDPEIHKAKAYMLGWSLGWLRAFPTFSEIDPLPFIQGDLRVHTNNIIRVEGDTTVRDKNMLKVGRIVTSDNAEGKVTYSIEILAVPALQYNYGQAGIWAEIGDDHHDS